MKKLITVSLLPFLLLGCSAVGGYKKLDDGSFLVTVHSNDFASREGIKEEFDDESKEACKGSYTLKKQLPSEVKKMTTYANGYTTTTNVFMKKQIIECNN